VKIDAIATDYLGRVRLRLLEEPERERHPNLASKILGLALRRLARDWQQRWGHEVPVVETHSVWTQDTLSILFLIS
jgi:hypothetical protein